MSGLAHDGSVVGTATGCGGGVTGAERVTCENLGVEACLLGGTFDDAGHRASRETLASDVAVAIDRTEHRADGDSRCGQPGLEGGDRTCGGVFAVEDANRTAAATLIGLRLRE